VRRRPSFTQPAMIAATLILGAITLLVSIDDASTTARNV
jgi:hypothetical protein